jgi:ABC-type antimicrobial peptide transport system permease subunit
MKSRPPKFAHRFFRWYCHPKLFKYIEGDLLELHEERVKSFGKAKADLNFLIDVVLLFRPGIIRPAEGTHHLTTYGMYKSYLKISWRNILKSKGYSFINIAGLAIGMASMMLIMLYIQDERKYDTFHQNSPHTYRIVVDWIAPDGSIKQHSGITGLFQAPKFQSGIPEIANGVRWQTDTKTLRVGNELSDQPVFLADPSFFSVFSFPLLVGDSATALKEPHSIVLTEERALVLFNTTQALGKTIDIKVGEGFEPYQVTGVVKSIPTNSSLHFEMIFPLEVEPREYENNENWFNAFLNTFIVLHPTTNPSDVEVKMNQLFEVDAAASIQMMKEKYNVSDRVKFRLQKLTDIHLSEEFPATNGLRDASNPMYTYILGGISIFIILIACINFVNLSLARSLRRAKEIGVRKVVGGNKIHLALQFLIESYILCFLSFVMAIVLVQAALPLFNQLATKSILLSSFLDVQIIGGYFILFLITGLLAGFYPAMVLSGFSPVKILYNRFRYTGNNLTQRSLVVIQFALASFLIMATITIYSQFDFLLTKDLGYDDKNLVMVEKFPLPKKEFDSFKASLLLHPDIQEVAPKNGGEWGTVAKVNGEQQIQFQYNIVDETFLPLMKIPVLTGRNFSPNFPSDADHSILVNEAFVKAAGWKDPIGQQVNFWYQNDTKYTVIGVVQNHHYNALHIEIQPQLFALKTDENFGMAYIRLSGKNHANALSHIEKTFKAQFPDFSYAYRFKEDENRQQYQLEARWKQIVLFGSILTIFISCIGLFGLAALAAERRTKEIGVRKVLGASVSSITQLLSFSFIQLVVMAFLVAVPLAILASDRWLSTYAYRVSFSAWTVLLTLLATGTIAFATVSFQAIRAARMNPVTSLKSE